MPVWLHPEESRRRMRRLAEKVDDVKAGRAGVRSIEELCAEVVEEFEFVERLEAQLRCGRWSPTLWWRHWRVGRKT